MATDLAIPPRPPGDPSTQFLCLTICGYRKPGMSEEDYRHHMTQISAPMTSGLLVKYGVKRWTMIHNTNESRALMSKIYDHQMANVADFDCFSQVIFHDLEDYIKMKQDPVYQENLVKDHEQFADTRRSSMTIGWVSEFIRDGVEVNGFKVNEPAVNGTEVKVNGTEINGTTVNGIKTV